jgi:hypothetical protein
MSTESETPENPEPVMAETQPAAPVQQMPQGIDPRRRLRELLTVPERDRTDAQWDEINELEIQLAPGNRVSPGHPVGSSDKPVGGGGGGRQFQQKKHPPKGGGGGGGGGKRRPRPGNNPNKPQQQ